MKIAVEIDIPDGEYCTGCDLLVNDYCRNYAGLLTKNLKTKEPVKFLSCIFACQKAMEQQTEIAKTGLTIEQILNDQIELILLKSVVKNITAEHDAALNELSALKEADRWIPTSEKLPDDERIVLAIEYDEIFLGSYTDDKWMCDESQEFEKVSYWRDLPEAPESEE